MKLDDNIKDINQEIAILFYIIWNSETKDIKKCVLSIIKINKGL